MLDLSKLNLPDSPTILDCGANEGQFIAHALPYLKGSPRIVAVEMLPEESAVCRLKFPQVEVINCAVGQHCGLVEYHRHEFSQSSSLLEMTEAHDRVWGSPTHTPVGRGWVPMLTIQEICIAVPSLATVDLLKLDLQGLELEALHGMEPHLRWGRVQHIICEVAWIELYEGQPLFAEINNLLKSYGFELVELFDVREYEGKPAAGDGWWRRP